MLFVYILLSILGLILSFVILWLLFYISCSLAVDKSKEYTSISRFYRTALNFAALTGIIVLRIKLKVYGKEKLNKNQNYLFVSNHRSNLDPIISWYAFREQNIAFVSKPENFQVPIFGNIIHRCGFIPINRDDPFKAIESINKGAKLLEKREMSVGVYPEGTRNTKDEMLPFHNGVLKIAQKSNTPIAVVSIKDSDKVNGNIPFKSTTIQLNVLEIIPAEELKGKRTNPIGDRIREILENDLNKK